MTSPLSRLARPAPTRRRVGTALLTLLRCARERRSLTPDESSRIAAEDPVELARLLAAHRVGPLVDATLSTAPDLAPLAALVRPLVRAQLGRTLAATLDLPPVVATFAQAEVRWTLVKGMAAAGTLYENPATREWHDVDLLVHGGDLARALEVLEGLGGVPVDRDWRRTADLRLGEIGLRLPRGTFLDLHWHPLNLAERRHAFHYDAAAVVSRARPLRVLGLDVPVPDAVDQAHHLAVHATLSGGWRLAWSYDVAQAADRLPDWDRLVEVSRSAGTELVVALALRRSRDLFDAAVPDEVLRALSSRGRSWFRVARPLTAWVPPAALQEPDWLSHRFHARTRGTGVTSARRFLVRVPGGAEITEPSVVDLGARREWLQLAATETGRR